ncbi:hypothetical protein [Deinococcus petrolearius]|uniref:CHRD domain-containing protein n=1 Tax=Deinococcus petrolearius TaxID=1751295 RepID=A0ABW1DKX6_9DEIO
MKRPLLLLSALLALCPPALGLKLTVRDPELQTSLGYGESSGGRFNVKLVGDYEGPVVVLFSQSDDEKARGLFPGLKSSYDGVMRAGQLFLNTDAGGSGAKVTAAPPLRTMSVPATGTSLGRFLQPFKLTVSLQTTGQSGGSTEPPRVTR